MKEGLAMDYIYNDEDNAPMTDDAWTGIHNPTVYGSRAEMKAVEENIPFSDRPEDGCWNCLNFEWNHEACTVNWNNMDESYYNPHVDDRELTDYCEYHETDPDADPECLMDGGNEP
jgi:hypothetical protein